MKVWVVVDEVDYEGGTVMGVFSTLELAEAYAKEHEAKDRFTRHFEIVEFELDVGEIPYWSPKQEGM
jgi:hypothetical protein